MSETRSPSSPESTARKLRMLTALFSICPRASTDESATEIYLRLCDKVPADVFEAAVLELMERWQYPHPPMPAEIIASAKKIARKARKARNKRIAQQREAENLLAAHASAMTQEEVKARMATLRASLSGRKRGGDGVQLGDILGDVAP